jgi:putative phage-type endonuclease
LKFIDEVQGSESWLAWRTGGIGASESPSIMGESPYQSARQLWEVKTGRRARDEENDAMRHGKAMEPIARAAFIAQYGEHFEPHCLEDDTCDLCGHACVDGESKCTSCKCSAKKHRPRSWLRASLDGINFDLTENLEIKCPVSRKWFLMAKDGKVPGHYYAQIQHQMLVCGPGVQITHFWSYYGGEGVLVKVPRDDAYILTLLDRVREFWRRVVNDEWPEHLPGDRNLGEDENWRDAAADFARLSVESARVEGELKKCKSTLAGLATHERTFGCGIQVLRYARKGNVDWKAIPAVAEMSDKQIDFYRKADIPIVEVTLIGEQETKAA